jgi:hypothetical protein
VEKILNSNYDRILGRFPLSKESEIFGVYARQGSKRFVSSVIFPDSFSEESMNAWLEMNTAVKDYRDNEVIWRSTEDGSEGFAIEDPVVFRAGEWKGITVTPSDMQSIEENAQRLKEFGENHQPILLNHDDQDVEKKVGKIINPRVVGDKVIPTQFLLTEHSAVKKFLNGTYSSISPFLRKDYTFDSGNGPVTLPGWTLREVSFVVQPQDKALNLTMNESEVLIEMPGNEKTDNVLELQLSEANKNVLKLQGDLATANTDLSTAKNALQLKETEVTTLQTKVKDLEDAARKTAVEIEVKGFESQFKLKPADHDKNVEYVLSLSEDQLTFWRKDVTGRTPIVIEGQEGTGLSGKTQTPDPKVATAEELLARNNITPVKGGK